MVPWRPSLEMIHSKITVGNQRWNDLVAPKTLLYPWDEKSTYIKSPPFLETMVLLCDL